MPPRAVERLEPRAAAQDADAVIVATPYEAAADALRSLGDLSGKVVIDITNPLTPDYMGLAIGHDTSAAEQIAKAFPGAEVVKGFNTLFAQAVLVVSPHWKTREAQVTGAVRPRTIHDFGGLDPALYDMSYPADCHPALAARTAELLRAEGWAASVNPDRGLDHGAWVPLMHLYPNHGVPVIQASMPSRLDAQAAFKYGRALSQYP